MKLRHILPFGVLLTILAVAFGTTVAQDAETTDTAAIQYDQLIQTQITTEQPGQFQFEGHEGESLQLSITSGAIDLEVVVTVTSPSGETTEFYTTDLTFAMDLFVAENGIYSVTIASSSGTSDPVPVLFKIAPRTESQSITPSIQPIPDDLPVITAENASQLVQVAQIGFGRQIPRFLWSPNGQFIAAILDSDIVLFRSNFAAPAIYFHPAGDFEFKSIAFSADSTQLAAAQNDGTVYVWDSVTGAQNAIVTDAVTPLTDPIGNVYVSFGSGKIVLGRSYSDSYLTDGASIRDSIFIWETSNWQVTAELTLDLQDGFGRVIRGVTISKDDSLVAGFYQNNRGFEVATVGIWSASTGEQLNMVNMEDDVYSLEFVGEENGLYISTGRSLYWMTGDIEGTPNDITPGVFIGDSSFPLAVSEDDSRVVVQDLDQIALFDASTHSFMGIIETDYEFWGVDANTLSAVSLMNYSTGQWAMIDALANTPLATLNFHTASNTTLAVISPDGNWVATPTVDNTGIELLNLRTGEFSTFTGPGNGLSVSGIAFSPDSRTLAGLIFDGNFNGVIAGWNLVTGEREVEIVFEAGSFQFPRIAYSPDGTQIALIFDQNLTTISGNESNDQVRWFDALTGETSLGGVQFPLLAEAGITSMNGLSLDVGTGNQLLLNPTSGNPLFQFPGVGTGSFSADGTLIITRDQFVLRVWAVGSAASEVAESGIPVVTYYTLDGIITSNPDGTNQSLLLRSEQGSIDTSVIWSPDGSTYTLIPYASWSPDSTKVAYVAHLGGNDGMIFVANPDGSEATELSQLGESAQSAAGNPYIISWSPDGQKLLYSYEEHGQAYGDLYTSNPQGTDIRQLTATEDSWEEQPRWSPDGSLIAFISIESLTYNSYLEVMNADGSNRRVLYTLENGRGQAGPFLKEFTWSPDGQSLLFTVHDTTHDVFWINLSGGDAQKIIENGLHPAWSPDGQYVAYQSSDDSVGNIFVMNADGSNRVQLTTTGGFWPNWRPIPGLNAQTVAPQQAQATVVSTGVPTVEAVAATQTPLLDPTLQPPTAQPTATLAPTLAPTATLTQTLELGIGVQAMVQVEDEGLKMRSGPGTDFAVIENLPNGTVVTIVDGPQDAQGYTWWFVQSLNGNSGWAVEAADGIETLVPVSGDEDDATVATPVSCPGLLPSRLVIGEMGYLLPGDPNNVRSEPTRDAPKIGEIYGGNSFLVLDGPVCADGYAWWQVDSDGLVGWTAESGDGDYWLEPVNP